MTDVSLNGLKVKTDSLPNDWYVSLINPKDGEPAEIMTIAKFVELFTPKQPDATITNKGLLSTEIYKHIMSKYKSYINSAINAHAIKIKTNLKVGQYGNYYFYCRIGQTQNGGICNQIVHLNIRLWNYKFIETAPISLGQDVIEDVVICEDNDGYIAIYVDFKNVRNLSGGVTDLLFRYYDESNSIVSVEFLTDKYISGSHLNEFITTLSNPSSYSLTQNALTDTITDNYPILPPPPANYVPNYSESAGSEEQFAVSAISETDNPDGSIPVRSEPQEQYVWSIDKIGRAVLELQAENNRLKQILNISDDSEVQQM